MTHHDSTSRVWFVSEVFHPETEGASYYITEVAAAVATRRETHVLCAPPTYSSRGVDVPRSEVYRDVHIRRCFTTRGNRHRIFWRIVNALTFCASVFLHLVVHLRRGDAVISTCYPPFVVLPTALAAAIRRTTHLVYVMDVHPDIAVAAGALSPRNPAVLVAKLVNRWVFHSSKRIIVIASDMKTYLQRKYGLRTTDVVSIPLFADPDSIYPVKRADNWILNDNGLQGKFIVGLAGNVGAVHDIDCLLKAATQLCDLPYLHFLVIGSGKRLAMLETAAHEDGLTNFTILPRMPRSESCNIVNACDVAIGALFIPGLFGLASPSRAVNILAAGKPIISAMDRDTELGTLIEQHDIGWRVDPGDADALARAIRAAYDDRPRLESMGDTARHLAISHHSISHVVPQFIEAVLSV